MALFVQPNWINDNYEGDQAIGRLFEYKFRLKKKDCIIGFEEDKIKYVVKGRGSLPEEELVQKWK